MTQHDAEMRTFDLDVRRMAPTDILAVVGMEQSVHGAPHWPRSHYEEALLVGSPRPRIALVASGSGEELAGFAIASLVVPDAELETIAVAGPSQRRGIGRQLLRRLVEQLHEQGIAVLHLEVRASNLQAIRFYESENFKKIGARRLYYADPEEDAILMALQMTQSARSLPTD